MKKRRLGRWKLCTLRLKGTSTLRQISELYYWTMQTAPTTLSVIWWVQRHKVGCIRLCLTLLASNSSIESLYWARIASNHSCSQRKFIEINRLATPRMPATDSFATPIDQEAQASTRVSAAQSISNTHKRNTKALWSSWCLLIKRNYHLRGLTWLIILTSCGAS